MCHGPRELFDKLGVGLSRECLAQLSLNGCAALEATYSRLISSSRSEGYSKELSYMSYTEEHSACSWDFRAGRWVEGLCH